MKKQLIADIIRMDKESKKLQREADLKFAEARNLNVDNTVPAGDRYACCFRR